MKARIPFSKLAGVVGISAALAFGQSFSGRVGASHDGNQHDPDDIGAAAWVVGIFAKAGSNLVHIDHSNHLADNDPTMEAKEKASVDGAAQRWYGTTSMVYNDQTNLQGAINNIAAQINKSTATDRFYLICAGPMEVAWRGINASDPAKRQYCTAISHSGWNDSHTSSQMTHTWSSIQSSGVNAVHIGDQNDNLNCFSNSCWDWAKNSTDEKLRFMHSRMVAGVFGDISDAGMAWYVVTGRGDQDCTPSKLQSFFTSGTPPPPNQSPTASFASPLNGATFAAPASFSVTVNASDPDGSISNVKLYKNGTLVRQESSAPYQWNNTNQDVALQNLAAGTYTLRADATDNIGAVTSVTISVTVGSGGGNLSPTVSLTSPSNGATFTAPASISLTATASDPDGSVSKVEFYQGSTLLGTSSSAPYAYSWTGVAAGSYSLTAKAFDNAGATTTSSTASVTVSTSSTNPPPVVSFTTPANGAAFAAPASFSVTVGASDPNGTVSNVKLYKNGVLVRQENTAPYEWNNTNQDAALQNLAAGTYTLRADATDNLGAVTSVTISVTVGSVVPPPAGSVTLQAESYSSMSGIQTETCSEGGLDVGWIENNDYIAFANVNLGTGATTFEARVASATSGGSIEVRLDNLTGTLVGTCAVSGTGGWQSWTTKSCALTGAAGTHTVYLKFVGGSGFLFNVNYVKFTGAGLPKFLNRQQAGTIDPTLRIISSSRGTVTFNLPADGAYDLSVFEATGNKVASVSSGQGAAGLNQAALKGMDLGGRVYLVRLRCGGEVATQRMTLIGR